MDVLGALLKWLFHDLGMIVVTVLTTSGPKAIVMVGRADEQYSVHQQTDNHTYPYHFQVALRDL